MLEVMRAAQNLEIGSPNSGETGVVLESILKLLEIFTPQFELRILLFDPVPLADAPQRVFTQPSLEHEPSWLTERKPGQASHLPSMNLLPTPMAWQAMPDRDDAPTFALPLHAPCSQQTSLNNMREVGLLFLLAREDWPLETVLSLGAKLSRFVTHRWFVHQEVNNKIHVDALTGLFNRGYLDAHLPLLLARAKRNQGSLALIVADIDLFKSINSEYGLAIGDQVLQMVAEKLKGAVRLVDVVCRRGGEEFAIILPETGLDAAREVVTRLLGMPFTLQVQLQNQQVSISVNLSYGVSLFPENAIDPDQLHNQAAAMMLLAKDSGRNRCIYHRRDGNHEPQKPGEVFPGREQA